MVVYREGLGGGVLCAVTHPFLPGGKAMSDANELIEDGAGWVPLREIGLIVGGQPVRLVEDRDMTGIIVEACRVAHLDKPQPVELAEVRVWWETGNDEDVYVTWEKKNDLEGFCPSVIDDLLSGGEGNEG